jgi:hypothetical protein
MKTTFADQLADLDAQISKGLQRIANVELCVEAAQRAERNSTDLRRLLEHLKNALRHLVARRSLLTREHQLQDMSVEIAEAYAASRQMHLSKLH